MTMDGGNCYEAAAIFLMDHMPNATLVHGYPILRREPYERFGHAWVEANNLTVHDVANGKHVEAPIQVYYMIGNINPDDCQRYTLADLRRCAMELKHWGPWKEEPDGVL